MYSLLIIFFSNWIKYYSYIYFMMVRIILYNNKDYNNKTPPHTHTHKKKSYFLKGIDWRKCDFSRRIDFFLNFGMKCPEVSEEVKHGIPRDTRRSAGHPSDDFLGYPDDALYRNIIRRYYDIMLVLWLCQNNNKIHYPDLPARYENKRLPRVSKIIRTL